MAAKLPDGSIVSLATVYGAAKAVTAITNANPGVATSVTHGLANGAILAVVSGWSKLNNRVARVSATATGTFAFEGFDTSSTTNYAAGAGVGTVQEITTFVQIAQIMGFTTTGGEQQFKTFGFLEDTFETQLPTITSAMSIKLDIADDPTLAGYIALKAAAEARAVRVLKVALPDGTSIYYQGYVSFQNSPTLNKGDVMQVSATLSLQNTPSRY